MAKYNPVELILKKRDGHSLDESEVSFFINGFLDGSIADYQMSALLMSCFFQGLNIEETKAFTRSYI
ncbi:MAG TPA: thymidine phosphorylase, partial [Candidatus Cloacimonas sp.]|nr:thymidine phosphorylase [Candidatus Cloacimonas sp.]